MGYVSEQICNISELKALIQSAYNGIADLRYEMEKESPSAAKIDELSKQIHLILLQAKYFEFRIERWRTTSQPYEKSPEELMREIISQQNQNIFHSELNGNTSGKN